METVAKIAAVLAALGILNVWLVRFNRSTEFRGGDAEDMREEFEVYGFPSWAVYIVGAVKVSLALLLLAGVWIEELIRPASIALGLLMVGAVLVHIRAGDRPKKYLPAATILVLSAVAVVFA